MFKCPSSVYLCFKSFLKWIPMTTGLRKTINIIMFKSIKESAENWLQPRGSRAGTHPTPAPTHPLPPAPGLLQPWKPQPASVMAVGERVGSLWCSWAPGGGGVRSCQCLLNIPNTHTHTRMLPTQLPVFAGLTDEVTRSWIRVTELAAISPPDTALFLGNTFQVPKYWLISSFWQLTHK